MKENTSLIFTGDIGFDKYMEGRWKEDDLIAPNVLSFLKNTDHLIINVEGPLLEKKDETDAKGAKALIHSMDPGVAGFFKDLGADIWNICNNHIMDAGEEGIRNTIIEAKNTGAKTLGAGMNLDEAKAPVIIEEAGGIGLIGVGYQRACRKASSDTPGCFSFSDLVLIKEEIKRVKEKCRWCVMVVHGGEEFTALPSPYTRERYIEYLDMGADIVICHHPHVPMNYERIGDKIIFYSLGNFIFDTDYQRSQYNTEKGIFIKLNFSKDTFSYEPFGIKIDRNTERVIEGELPKIFVDVNEEEYRKLIPLSSKMFIENTKKQLKYLYPDKFKNASEEDFVKNFYEPLRSGRVPGEVLDFQIIYPLSLKEEEKKWKESKLESVKEYILEQLEGLE